MAQSIEYGQVGCDWRDVPNVRQMTPSNFEHHLRNELIGRNDLLGEAQRSQNAVKTGTKATIGLFIPIAGAAVGIGATNPSPIVGALLFVASVVPAAVAAGVTMRFARRESAATAALAAMPK